MRSFHERHVKYLVVPVRLSGNDRPPAEKSDESNKQGKPFPGKSGKAG
jgi:hypothetical protein